MAGFQVEASQQEGCAVLRVHGELDSYTAPQFRSALLETIGSAEGAVVIDLQPTEFIDSTALGVIAEGAKRAAAYEKPMRIAVESQHILKLLEITSMGRVAKIYRTVDDACSEPALSGPAA